MDKEKIINGLKFLKKYDKKQPRTLYGFKTYGANKHLFRLNPVIQMSEVVKFELKHKIKLPDDYKFFITKIGNGGAGPGNGLFSLQKWDYELENLNLDFLSIEFPHKKEDNWNMNYTGDENNDTEYLNFENEYYSTKYVSGAIRISDYGCGINYMLVTSGNEHGKIWVDDRCSDYGIYGACNQETKEQFTFETWYLDWLNSSIDKLDIKNDHTTKAIINTGIWHKIKGLFN